MEKARLKTNKEILLRLNDDIFTKKLYKTYKDASKHTTIGVLIVRVDKLEPSFISMQMIYDRVQKMFALTNKSEYDIFKDYLQQLFEATIQFDISIEEVLREENEIEKNNL